MLHYSFNSIVIAGKLVLCNPLWPLWFYKNDTLCRSKPVVNTPPHHTSCNIPWAATPAMLQLPGRRFSCGLASVVEYTGAWPSAKHGRPRAFPPGETQINVRVEEPGVGVLFHQAVDFHLGCFKTALCGLCYVLLDGHLGVVVNVDLSERKLGHNEKPCRITDTDMTTYFKSILKECHI